MLSAQSLHPQLGKKFGGEKTPDIQYARVNHLLSTVGFPVSFAHYLMPQNQLAPDVTWQLTAAFSVRTAELTAARLPATPPA